LACALPFFFFFFFFSTSVIMMIKQQFHFGLGVKDEQTNQLQKQEKT